MRTLRSLALLLTVVLFVTWLPAVEANTLLEGEVFLDDTGLSPGTGMPFVLDGENTDALRIGAGFLDLTGVEPGSHTIYVRFKDENNVWSPPLGQSFYVTEGNTGGPLLGGQNQVVTAEAFIDVDPGEGNGVPLDTAADGTIDSATELLGGAISLGGLSIGVHVLNTRVLDSTGVWSSTNQQTFFVPTVMFPGSSTPPILLAAKGIIDDGPAISLPADDGTFDDVVETVTLTKAVSDDYHSALIRFQDNQGLWSWIPDQDVDYDGIADTVDNCPNQTNADQLNSDNDTMGNACDPDDDNDALPDSWETANELNPLDAGDALLDADQDGVSNLDEYFVGTDPQDDQSNPDAINLALDTKGYEWRMSGDARWVVQNTVYHVGNNALQSGAIANLEQSSIEMTVTGPVPVSFYWKVSSESSADFLIFYIDDIEMDSISGEVDWQLKKYKLSPGSHMLRWTYSKDDSNWDGLDSGWLDGVSTKFRGMTPILFLLL